MPKTLKKSEKARRSPENLENPPRDGLSGRRWRDEYYVRVFELARTGLIDREVATAIGTTPSRFKKWLAAKPALRDALARARSREASEPSSGRGEFGKRPSGEKFTEYAFKRLPPELQPFWAKLCEAEEAADGSAEKLLEALTRDKGLRARQHLWVHAFVTSNFNAAEASRRLNIPYTTYKQWAANDPEFGELLRHLTGDMRKDWIEGSVMDLVAMRDSAVTIFAAKTQLADRGYNPAKKLELSGATDVNHRLHQAVDVTEVLSYCSIEARREILEAIAAMRDGKLPPREVKALPE